MTKRVAERQKCGWWTVLLGVALVACAGELRADVTFDDTFKSARQTMGIEEVKVGMRGYGLTVFHGVTPEPFAVEVVSVQQDFSPDRGVIWVRCPDERMQKTGPVQGMSGSPIYLWGAGERGEVGKGGRLIGAFAFGFAQGKDCYVGIQPIAFMRDAAHRVGGELKKMTANESPAVVADGAVGSGEALVRLAGAYRREEGSPDEGYIARALAGTFTGRVVKPESGVDAQVPRELGSGEAARLLMPVGFSSQRVASQVRPLLEPMGLSAMAGAWSTAGKPPDGIDPAAVKFEPGAALSIPLAWGPIDICALGTVTDVLPDGRVLAFGHPMLGQGSAAFPMATGYVHFVQPSLGVSFKVGGSAAIRGTILRDERAAIVGAPVKAYSSMPLTITVNMPAQKPAVFKYEVAQIKSMMPAVIVAATLESINSAQAAPFQSTIRLRGFMNFEGGRRIDIDTLVTQDEGKEGQLGGLLMTLAPPLMVMIQNQHQSLAPVEVSLNVDVTPRPLVATLGNVRLDRAKCRPGEKVGISVRLHPFGGEAFDKRLELTVPEATPEGDYMLMVCDPSSYLQSIVMSKPHLLATTGIDDLVSLLRRVMSVKSDSVYVVMFLAQEGVVVGRREMPLLPTSRRALLASPEVTSVSSFTSTVERSVSTGLMVNGGQMFSLRVRKNPQKD